MNKLDALEIKEYLGGTDNYLTSFCHDTSMYVSLKDIKMLNKVQLKKAGVLYIRIFDRKEQALRVEYKTAVDSGDEEVFVFQSHSKFTSLLSTTWLRMRFRKHKWKFMDEATILQYGPETRAFISNCDIYPINYHSHNVEHVQLFFNTNIEHLYSELMLVLFEKFRKTNI